MRKDKRHKKTLFIKDEEFGGFTESDGGAAKLTNQQLVC